MRPPGTARAWEERYAGRMNSRLGMAAAEGQPSPGFKLPEARGGFFELADALAGGSHALLVFLRHYG